MKKFTLLSAVLVAGMATAQVEITTPMNLEVRKARVQTVEMNKAVSLTEWDATNYGKKAPSANYDLVDYYVVDGMMYAGLTEDWGMYGPMIVLPSYQNVVFENLYGPTTWMVNGEIQEENSETFEMGDMPEGMWYLPQTTDHILQVDDTTQYSVKGYLYGSAFSAQYLLTGTNHMATSDGSIIPLTLCEMFCDPEYRENGYDITSIVAQSIGCPYAYGTDMVYQGLSFDTIMSVVRNVNPLKIESINIPVWNTDNGDLAKMLPEGAQVKVELIAADLTTGKIYTDSIYASTIIDSNDCIDFGDGSATLIAYFTEEDPFGGVMPVSVVVPGDFALQITGYNESNCDFGFMADFYAPTGSTLFAINGKYTEFWSGGSNLAISYVAYWPTVVSDTTLNVMNAPVEGGVAYYGEDLEDNTLILYTNVYDVENTWNIEVPEWIEYAIDYETYMESASAVIMMFQAAALPAEVEGRTGVVTIDADGCVYELTINQGKVASDETAIENVVAPAFNGKIYNLLGVEVDENYKGIVIKNGQKYIQ